MKQTIEYIIVCCIGLIFSIPVAFKIVVSVFTQGLKTIKGVNYRSRPRILTDPRFGKSSYLHLKDITLHCIENGDPRKPLLLLVHGFPEFWFSWRHQLDSDLAKNYRIVAIDMRGYGDSDKPRGVENYRIEKLVEDIRQAINSLGYDKCYLAGHDWGGAVVWSFAMAHPGMVTKLAVLNCPHPVAFQTYIRSNLTQFLKSWYMFFFQLPCFPEWLITRQDLVSMDIALKGVVNQQELDAFKYTFSSATALTGPINFYRAAFRYPSRGAEGGSRKQLTVPTMLVFGANDKYITQEAAKLSGKYCSQMEFQLVPQASHWVQQDAPDQVNRLLIRFFGSSSGGEDDSGDDLRESASAAVRRGLDAAKDIKDGVREDVGQLLGDLNEH
ncbi:hypothetical protein BOX15_Mlig013242g1 [Macrostomum lignano]|uniref:Uncharacterized protein n=2 Tax=Macrostomum lignano TaxID=282301 RepID=A0A267GKU4_9PLAT|nr:hypothetical protein BOX15_Mlig013242g1 [Macrostomum lignano]